MKKLLLAMAIMVVGFTSDSYAQQYVRAPKAPGQYAVPEPNYGRPNVIPQGGRIVPQDHLESVPPGMSAAAMAYPNFYPFGAPVYQPVLVPYNRGFFAPY